MLELLEQNLVVYLNMIKFSRHGVTCSMLNYCPVSISVGVTFFRIMEIYFKTSTFVLRL